MKARHTFKFTCRPGAVIVVNYLLGKWKNSLQIGTPGSKYLLVNWEHGINYRYLLHQECRVINPERRADVLDPKKNGLKVKGFFSGRFSKLTRPEKKND